eukprot:jgi/Botrbrau1/20307/Bobra.0851s0001.2
MLPITDAVRQLQVQSITILKVWIICAVAWLLWARCIALISWARIDIGIRKSGIRRGPAFWHALSGASSRQLHRVLLEWVEQYGPVFFLRLGPVHVVVVSDMRIAAEVLRPSGALDKGGHYDAVAQMTSEKGYHNLVSSPSNARWRMIRKTVAPAFSMISLKQAFPNMQKVMARTVAHLRDSGSVDGVVNMTRVLECRGDGCGRTCWVLHQYGWL